MPQEMPSGAILYPVRRVSGLIASATQRKRVKRFPFRVVDVIDVSSTNSTPSAYETLHPLISPR